MSDDFRRGRDAAAGAMSVIIAWVVIIAVLVAGVLVATGAWRP